MKKVFNQEEYLMCFNLVYDKNINDVAIMNKAMNRCKKIFEKSKNLAFSTFLTYVR